MSQSTTIKTPHWNAEIYHKNSIKLQQNTVLELLSSVTLKENDAILDIGAGDGKISHHIAESVPKGFVKAFDLSGDMIELAQKHYSHMDNLSFWVDDAENFKIDDKFDWIFSFFCLQWVKDKQKAFKQIAASLKPGGKVGLIMTDRNPYLLKIREELYKQDEYKEYFLDYVDATDVIDDDKYEQYATEVGLTDIRYTEYPKTLEYDSKEELSIFIMMVTSAIKRLPTEELQQSFVEKLVDQYIEAVAKDNPDPNKTNNQITYTIKIVQASK